MEARRGTGRNRRRTLHALVGAAVLATSFAFIEIIVAGDAAACNGLRCPGASPPPAATDDGFYSRIASEVNRLNNGGSESGGPPPCSEEDVKFHEHNGTIEHVGHRAYQEPSATQDDFRAIDGNTAAGTYWRLACIFDDGYDPGYPGISIDFFPLVNPQNLARLAVAEALTGVPAPEVRMSPPVDDQLVNFETYLWVEGIATTEFTAPAISVPGITVQVTVKTGGVYWDMGDGNSVACPGTGQPEGSCSYIYATASRTADEHYHGSASVRWTATYTINGDGPYDVADAVVRQTPFSVRVAEGQAVVTGG